jgi:hypothetical protein
MPPADEPVDAVYTWVDDSFPGYLDELNRFVADRRDPNPNRTRDNLDLLKYSLRSLAANAGFFRRIYILSCRPQVPRWLDVSHPRIRIVHHDEVMRADLLPVFNSFAIVSHLHLLPGLSRRFVYFEDDMLAPAGFDLSRFSDAKGRALLFTRGAWTKTRAELDAARSSPWNLAMATAGEALDRAFGARRRRHVVHGPRLIDRDIFAEMVERFPAEIEATRRSRFRADGNVPCEYLYPHFLRESGRGEEASRADSRRMEGYASLENFLPWSRAQLTWLEWRRPWSITLNDSFGQKPNPAVVRHVRATLERWFPQPSPFELGADGGTL